jgi:hypothetical protein
VIMMATDPVCTDPVCHVLVCDITGFNELVGRKKSSLPGLGTRTKILSLGCRIGLVDCVTSMLLWWGGYFFYLAIAYGIGIFTWISSSKYLFHKLPEIDCF